MTQPIQLEGFEGQQIEVKAAGIFSGTKLLINGEPAKKGAKRGQMLLQKNDGTEVIATWQPTMLGFDTPKLVVEESVVEITKPIKWYEMVWSALPILLIFIGGIIGVIVGFIGFTINAKVFRSEMNTLVKFLITAGISLASGVAYFVLAMIFYAVIG